MAVVLSTMFSFLVHYVCLNVPVTSVSFCRRVLFSSTIVSLSSFSALMGKKYKHTYLHFGIEA